MKKILEIFGIKFIKDFPIEDEIANQEYEKEAIFNGILVIIMFLSIIIGFIAINQNNKSIIGGIALEITYICFIICAITYKRNQELAIKGYKARPSWCAYNVCQALKVNPIVQSIGTGLASGIITKLFTKSTKAATSTGAYSAAATPLVIRQYKINAAKAYAQGSDWLKYIRDEDKPKCIEMINKYKDVKIGNSLAIFVTILMIFFFIFFNYVVFIEPNMKLKGNEKPDTYIVNEIDEQLKAVSSYEFELCR